MYVLEEKLINKCYTLYSPIPFYVNGNVAARKHQVTGIDGYVMHSPPFNIIR